MHPEATYARRALEIGARGYIMKSESGDKVLQAIRCVLEGRIYVSEAIAGHLLEFLSHRSKKKQTGIDSLAPREFEVFKLIGEGVSTVMIAKALNMSPKTVESHRARIKEKLQTKTISELIAHAAGWVARQSMADQSGYAMVH
jgi:DNA-binding NarL/FixJ family response regulator